MKNEAQAKEIMLKSPIFQNCWGNPHKKPHKFPKKRQGGGKGKLWFEMYQDISAVLPEVKTLLNIGVGFKKAMNNETIRWMHVYDKMFGPIDRFANVDILPNIVKQSEKAVKGGAITGRAVDYLKECYCGNVKALEEIEGLSGPFDMLVWSHGPEHVYRREWVDCFDSILTMAKVVVIQLPWGAGYNSEPTHYAPSVRKGELEEFGFDIKYVGVEDTMQSCMYGWRLGDIPC
jgi:hypothetical protein